MVTEKKTTTEKNAAKKTAKHNQQNEQTAKTAGKPTQEQAVAQPAQPQPEEHVPVTGDPYAVLKFVVMTEKAVQQIERQNKLVFIVDRAADKKKIRQSAAQAFNTTIGSINTVIDQSGRKKAFIRFVKAGEAGEIAIRLGII